MSSIKLNGKTRRIISRIEASYHRALSRGWKPYGVVVGYKTWETLYGKLAYDAAPTIFGLPVTVDEQMDHYATTLVDVRSKQKRAEDG